jgi:hypothetical protein
MRRRLLAVTAFLAIFLAFFSASATLMAQQPLDNVAIVKMIKAGLSEDLIVSTINSQPGTYNIGADGLIALKKAGATDKVLGAVVLKASGASAAPVPGSQTANGPAAPPVAPGPPEGVTEVGIYYKNAAGAWTELLPEVVNFKSKSMLKSVSTVGIVRPNLNGHVQGSRAKLALNFPVTLAIYMPEGTSITEYQLLRLHTDGDAREFRSVTGSAFHSNNGDARDNVEFQSEKIAPHIYQITLAPSFGRGEYGLLPPGSVSSSKAGSTGKLYTMSVTE